MAPTLPDLPVEIFNQIIDELPYSWLHERPRRMRRKQEILSLRCLSRDVEIKTRIRFGEEFFFTLPIWDDTIEYLSSVSFVTDLVKCCDGMPRLTALTFGGPVKSSAASVGVQQRIQHTWEKTVSNVLVLLSVHKSLNLNALAFGREPRNGLHGLSLPTPIHLFTTGALGAGFLETLKTLKLLGFRSTAHSQLGTELPSAELPTVTDATRFQVASLLGSMPELTSLTYHGHDPFKSAECYVESPLLFLRLRPPPLTELELTSLAIADDIRLGEMLKVLSGSLKRLTLERVVLLAGNLMHVFGIFVDHLQDLRFLCLNSLVMETHQIGFQILNRNRPVTVDADFYEANFEWYMFAVEDQESQGETATMDGLDRVSMITDMLQNEWAFVFNSGCVGAWHSVTLDAAEDGNLTPWMEAIRDEHEAAKGRFLGYSRHPGVPWSK
ncbi:hypothetical protein BDW02DRAFT_645848 [Decorospora gaudefroyi]|uniref:Uncharacterized protein n=1 Tax=Decorospora gaudefroyi TaxID=184978 RepID=A0A6A5KR59_9PLEO|nr:hypothetical protein BDW02DRAFT_645848 [Decorospora gaudefroyi]